LLSLQFNAYGTNASHAPVQEEHKEPQLQSTSADNSPQTSLTIHLASPQSGESSEIANRWLAGYVLDYNAALKLSSVVSGIPIPIPTEGIIPYPSLVRIEESIDDYLESKGMDFYVDIDFTGEAYFFSTILATSGSYGQKGPPLADAPGRKDEIIREWLEAKGDLSSFLACHLLTSSTEMAPGEYKWEICVDKV